VRSRRCSMPTPEPCVPSLPAAAAAWHAVFRCQLAEWYRACAKFTRMTGCLQHRHGRPGMFRLLPVDAFQEHGQLRGRQMRLTAFGLRPDEAAAFQSLAEQAHAVAGKPEYLEQVAALAAEDKDMPGEGILFER